MNSIRSTMSVSRSDARLAQGLLFLACVGASGMASAGPGFYCTGNLLELGLGQDGTVNIKLVGDNEVHGICNTDAQMPGGMVVSNCKAAYATLLANRMTQTPVRVYYYSNATTTNCTTFPSWNNMPAYFVEVPAP